MVVIILCGFLFLNFAYLGHIGCHQQNMLLECITKEYHAFKTHFGVFLVICHTMICILRK